MQNLTIAQTVTMSSREIAELTDKKHFHVLRDIESMLVDLGEDPEGYAHFWIHPQNGQQYREFLLDRDHTECLLTGYSAVHRMRVIKRWHDLEKLAATPALPENYISALEALLESKKSEAALALVNKEQEAELHDLKSLFKEGMTPTQFCKMLNGVNTQKVNHWLADRNWLYNESQSGTRWRATSYARDRYLTEHQHLIGVHGANDFIKYQPVLLHKGAERLYVLYRRGKVPMKLNWNGDFTHQKHVSLAS
ncbi:Rha family transcriptional regulator [Symbiopectobacterium sp. RP]